MSSNVIQEIPDFLLDSTVLAFLLTNSGSVTLLTPGLFIKALDCLILSYDLSLLLRHSKRVARGFKIRPSLAMSST